ncbi:MAG: CsbD family protein [Pseudonocardia sp.]|nr:CsbD family protein [Pseudonocardia sp.]
MPALARWKECLAMGFQNKIASRVQVLRGKAKEAAGRISNRPGLTVDGKLEQGMGHVRQAGEKMKDAGWSLFRR